MLTKIDLELRRLSAIDVRVEIDEDFEPETGRLVKVSHEGAFWHLLPGALEELLEELPDGAGGDAIKQAIEGKAHPVWHGPSPEGSRDTTL
jgi:hypothetical protein